jgi:hypothetical protein
MPRLYRELPCWNESNGQKDVKDAGEGRKEYGDAIMNKSNSGAKEGNWGDSPAQLIDARIADLVDWRGETLARVRSLITEADPEMVEEWKWRGVPVWSHAGIICTG